MKASNSTSWLLVAAVNALLPLGILLFAKGFFPYKPFLPGLAVFDVGAEPPPPAPFDKVIFMVVDALRSDFVFSESSAFNFTQSLISSGSAVPFTAHATSPTITMPRVKAITTGSIPSFLDVILNFAESDTSSSLGMTQDNWLAQIRQRGGKLVMYGDDTWLKLFPGMFGRSDGTSSFFVSDFTEVDNNVTRHIDNELKNNDWDGMIMHYLGLDHIGHKAGPRSSFMLPKQSEMDAIVKKIYNAIESETHLQSTLFVLAGDHGMNDAGNHGGSAPGETSPALVFMSPKFKKIFPSGGRECPTKPSSEFNFYKTVEQSDLVPSLSGLLGMPVPRNNLGVFIPEILKMWNADDRVKLALRNAEQLLEIVRAAYPNFGEKVSSSSTSCSNPITEVDELACLWKGSLDAYANWRGGEFVSSEAVLELLLQLSTRCQDILSMVAGNYNLGVMAGGMLLSLIAAGLAITAFIPLWSNSALSNWVFPSITLIYGVMMFASSFVEEEHHFWYWVASGWCILVFVKERRNGTGGLYALLILALLRVSRRWNQTGQKWAGAPDIAKSYLPKNPTFLWILIIITYSELFIRTKKHAFRRAGPEANFVLSFVTTASAFTFKLAYAAYDSAEMVPAWLQPLASVLEQFPLVTQARTVFGVVAAGIIYTIVFELRIPASYHSLPSAIVLNDFLNVFLLTQVRVVNVPLLLIFQLINRLLSSMTSLSAPEITISTLIMQHFSFFALGGTNSISSVDLSNAYNGVSGYNIVLVGILTFVSNWVGPIFWSISAVGLLARKRFSDENAFLRHAASSSVFQVFATLAVMVACTVMRTHLFIWTVFSPKYLYSMAWGVAYRVFVDLGIGGMLYFASKRAAW